MFLFKKGVFMKKLKRVSIVLACLVVLAFASCDSNGDTGGGGTGSGGGGMGPGSGGAAEAALNGTWVHAYGEVFVLNNGNFEHSPYGTLFLLRGTYNVAANFIVFTPTHVNGVMMEWGVPFRLQWLTRDEMILDVTNSGLPESDTYWMIPSIHRIFTPVTETFVLGDNTLLLMRDDSPPVVLTRRN